MNQVPHNKWLQRTTTLGVVVAAADEPGYGLVKVEVKVRIVAIGFAPWETYASCH